MIREPTDGSFQRIVEGKVFEEQEEVELIADLRHD
jgi:hypothetical protein